MPAPRTTFGIVDVGDMLDKATRELDRLKATERDAEVRDHAVNFAWTAWHIADWAWEEIKDAGRVAEITAKVAAALAGDTKWQNAQPLNRFREYIRQTFIPDLEYCGPVAVQTKHREQSDPRLRADLAALVSVRVERPLIENAVVPFFFAPSEYVVSPAIDMVQLRATAKYDEAAGKSQAVPIFERILAGWRNALTTLQLI
ncbi:MAG TPA: hypothetical protein VJ924_16115 [Alphaproteobacteria bacterium]|nr:hypothetical protein [Alphaproteobacteria bacterium]